VIELKTYLELVGKWLLTSGIQICLILIMMALAIKLSHLIVHKVFTRFQKTGDEEYQKRADTLSSIIKVLIHISIYVVGLIIILGELGIEIGPILAAAGILGLAVGFGAQNLVQDVISGFFLLLEDQIRVGDVVSISGKSGLVEKITLRMVIIRDLSGNVHYVRNGKIDIVTNMTKDYSRYVFEIGVAYKEDIDQVCEIISQVDEDLRNDPQYKHLILEPIEILGLDDFADSAVIIKARTKTKPVHQWTVGREFKRRLKKRFDAEGIEIPFPHLTLYIGQEKNKPTAPLQVDLQSQTDDLAVAFQRRSLKSSKQ
jgi:small conductance mechanosensitive channel